MKVGFSGTSRGMTTYQMIQFHKLISRKQNIVEFHHGDCVGADAQAHAIISRFFPQVIIVVHPPVKDYARAFCQSSVIRAPEEYLKRNRAIVDETDFLIAAPLSNEEVLRSGTWSTIRYAKKNCKQVELLFR